MTGWQGPSAVRKVRGAPPLVSRTVVQLYDGKSAWHAGFVTFDRVSTEHEVRWDETRRGVVVASYCDFEGFALEPGAQIATETLRMEAGSDPYAALEHWADAAAQGHGRIRSEGTVDREGRQ